MRYVALLRAVNVGGRTVKMDELRALFEAIPFANVETFIASGNVIFESKGRAESAEQKIEAALEEQFGFAVPTFVRSASDIAAAAANDPFAALEASPLYVGFLRTVPDAKSRKAVDALEDETNSFAFDERQVYWRATEGMGRNRISGPMLERALGQPVTFRSITTVRKLAAKYPPR